MGTYGWDEMVRDLAYWSIVDEKIELEKYANIDDWDNGLAKEVVVEFKTYLQNGYTRAYARHLIQDKLSQLKSNGFRLPEHFVDEYKDLVLQRRALRLASEIIHDPEKVELHYQKFQTTGGFEYLVNFKENTSSALESFKKRILERKTKISIKDWPMLSECVGGFNGGRVGLITAMTGFGKTNLAVSLITSAAKSGNVLYVNQEMSKEDFYFKILSSKLELSLDELEKNYELLLELKEKLPENIYFTVDKSFSSNEIISYCAKVKPWFVVVDYDQKLDMRVSKEIPEWKALQIEVEKLEQMAKQMNIFVLMLSQEGSDGDVAASKRSKNPATFVLRFHREEIGEVSKNLITCIKNRFGPNDFCIEVNYQPEKSLVKEEARWTKKEIQKMKDAEEKKNERSKLYKF